MDVSSMMNALQQHDAAKRVSNGIGVSRGNGMLTSATATTGAGKLVASSGKSGAVASGAAAGAATGASSTASGTGDSSDITSSDFLTLLVAEMQNQDPTQPTDPNTYIQQLVGVNSLQQLISINSELATATGSSASSGGSSSITPPVSGGVNGS
jgi:flagellar basal-body rod modification protein FlgD